jgi:hypothetical protein
LDPNTNKKRASVKAAITSSPADALFDKYTESYQTPSQKLIHWVCMVLVVFSLLGIVWSIPFPYLKFLGQYNGFFSWASFLIAAGVYYYYKVLPGISYLTFILFFALSYGIMQLDNWHKAGGPALWLISSIIFLTAASVQFANLRLKNKKPSLMDGLQFMIISPIWVLHFLFKKRQTS